LRLAWLVLAHVVVGALGLLVLSVIALGLWARHPSALGMVCFVVLVMSVARVARYWMDRDK